MTDTLNNLVRINIDASKGYSLAAENIENDNFRNFLQSYAEQREKYAEQLKDEIVKIGGEPVSSTSVLGDIHRGVMKMREAVSPSRDSALLTECSRGEGEALAQYKKTLETTPFSVELRRMIMTQFDKIRAAKSTMDELVRVV